MNVIDTARIGPLRMRLVARPASDPELADRYYLVSDHTRAGWFCAIIDAGFDRDAASDRMYDLIDREIAKRVAESEGAK